MDALDDLNDSLAGVTVVKRLEFSGDLETGRCSVELEIVDDHRSPTKVVTVRAGGVAEFSVQGFGGGITQVACLRVEDVRHLQHDRIRFILEDLEHRALVLKCETVAVTQSVAVQ